MASRFQSRGWRRFRTCFRGLRIAVLFLVLLVIGAGYYLNQIGLPDFVKRPLLEKLHARGLDLKFTRLRWRYYRGLVAENVRFGRADEATATGPGLSAGEVELKLNHAALRHFEVTVDSVILHDGRLDWPLAETNGAPRKLSVENIQTRLRFLTNDEWQLDHFSARFAGAALEVSGAVTNASALRDWKVFQPGTGPATGRAQDRLRELADTLERVRFSDTPGLELVLHGDGRDPLSFSGLFTARTRAATTPWGSLTNGYLKARLLAGSADRPRPHGDVELEADAAETRWGGTEHFKLRLEAATEADDTNLVHCRLEVTADRFTTEWARSAGASFGADWVHSLTNAVPLAGFGSLRLDHPSSTWGEAEQLRLEGRISAAENHGERKADASWGWWAELEPYALDWNCKLTGVKAQEFQVKEISCGGGWRAPELTITNLHSELYGGQFDVQAGVDVATRVANFSGRSDFDAHSLGPLLTEKAREWMAQYTWDVPPLLAGGGGAILPAWTNRHPDWRGKVLPTLTLEADLKAGAAAYRLVPVLSAQMHISLSNEVWNLPDIVAVRPEGIVRLAHIADDRTHNYYFRVHSEMDVKALRPLLDEKGQHALDELELTRPPVVDAEIWGRWHDYERTGFEGTVALTNFSYRGEAASEFQSGLQYTNHYLQFDHPRVTREARLASADSVGVDFDTHKLYLTNGYSTLEPLAILHAIGPKVTKTMEPYQFLRPPTARANGIIPLEDGVPAQVRFDLEGGPFHWSRFNVAHISGGVDWTGDRLTLTGVQADFYGGRMGGTAAFDMKPGESTRFTFDTGVEDVNLGAFMADVFSPSNHLEGKVSGHLTVSRADTEDRKSWFGEGRVSLRDGLIWDIPMFGIFSKVLDAVVPGLGESRASEGTADFVITNSVIRSQDLEIRAPALRMFYGGTVDFDGKVDARVEAALLRDAPLIGPLLSTVLWPFTKVFEYKVTGTLGDPKPEPLLLPARILMMPLHPFKTLKDFFAPEAPGGPAGTNAPPVKPP